MRKLYMFISVLSPMLFGQSSLAQSNDENYILSQRNISPSKSIDEYQYYDGLGRLVEKVSVNLSPESGVDLLESTSYDAFGYVLQKGKPVALSGNLGNYTDVTRDHYISDYKEPYAYMEYFYENSPLGRKTEERGPGAAWIVQGKKREISYLSNSTKAHLNCLSFELENDVLSNKSYYPDGTLNVIKQTDEDGRVTYEFKDFLGRLILSRRVFAETDVDTYYIYDSKGDLAVVLPPEASSRLSSPGNYSCKSAAPLLDYAYLYSYDEFHRCVSKKLPGADAVAIRYDNMDRPVFIQSGVQKASGTATQMSYAPFGRLSSKSDGTQSLKVFYDNYDFMSNKPSLGYVQKAGYGNRADNVIGLQTGEIVSAEVGKELYSVCYYDKKGQLVQKRSENHLGGLDCYYYLYTYTGKVASMLHEHIVGSSKQEEIYSYVYDNADRLLQVTHQLNGGEKVILRQNVYDKLCRLSSQKVFGKENVSYEYNIREWPTSISSENYKETLSYYGGNYRMYGGNVTSMTWSVGNETLVRKYNFSYDTLYRLTSASYWEDNAASGHYDTRYTYDLMGNMLTLKRNGLQDGGTYGAIDNVSFIYKGNQMLRADDNVEDPTYKDAWNFVDGASENIEYEYDKNGNMVKDLNKGIQSISYNSLNLPTQIKLEGGKNISYVYDANGKKLQASYTTSLPRTSMTLDYCDNMVYENGVLSQILVEDGYISFTNGKPVYHYYLKDHLGSNRVVVNHTTGEVEQVNHYYPFGGLMAESTGGSVQRYKYNGKELDGMHGLDWCDYGARWYDGMRFLTQDPHATDYVGISPYTYCANNPINAIDIDGKDSYYTTEGIYVCDNLKETDFVYIVSDYKYLRQLSNNNWLVEFKGKQSITDADITAKAYSNIFTNVLKRKNFDTSLLENGSISVRILDSNSANSGPLYECKDSFEASDEIPWSDAPIATELKNADNQIKITANVVLSDSERRNYLSTVSNIENVLGVHEFLGHGVLNYAANEHWKILNMQMKHPSWKKTTKELKELYEYLKKKRPNEYLQH